MLIIRTEQMRRFADRKSVAFEESLASYVKERYPALAPQADSFTRQARRQAASYELNGSHDILIFVDLCAVYGLAFDQEPANKWMRATLTDPAITSPSERLRVLTADLDRRRAIREHNERVQRPSPAALPSWIA